MNYAYTIILTITLVTLFCCFFGWCLMRSCRRVIDAEMHELACQRESASGASNKASSKVGSKTNSKVGSKANGK
ncbi:hypothetical protein COCMIDRAFT_109369 [Bipolaris oryzae ATCC 44560]|uniref:Uncharacterized protein n=1 Tax=Bipolaris oryzae ATCC 44560 TaxID=930090 RepID=W6YXG5_COCMI|nr:uncharacterized protein COCMIDRAFT_109369 [Bipolaris oryzae ATCC 44560]EUC40224.1 hypothetical protein COCMIDRAFT_109369 [Bipolaris oryzae ATCC 44560]